MASTSSLSFPYLGTLCSKYVRLSSASSQSSARQPASSSSDIAPSSKTAFFTPYRLSTTLEKPINCTPVELYVAPRG